MIRYVVISWRSAGALEPAGRRDDDLAAVQQRHPDLVHGYVKGVRGHQQHPRVPFDRPLRVVKEPHHVLLGHRDALGLAGGAGRVDDVGQLTGVDRHLRVDGWLVGDGRIVRP